MRDNAYQNSPLSYKLNDCLARNYFVLLLPMVFTVMVGIGSSRADDIEIYQGNNVIANSAPNLLFVLDASNSMLNYDCANRSHQRKSCKDGTTNGTVTRLDRIKGSLRGVLDTITGVNVGLMSFSTHDGGAAVIHPIVPVEKARQDVMAEVDKIKTTWGTPTVGALIEAQRYLTGDAVLYGKQREGYAFDRRVNARFARVSADTTYNKGRVVRDSRCRVSDYDSRYCATERIVGEAVYESPVNHGCQANHIILLTDGQPTQEPSAVSYVEKLIGRSCNSIGRKGGVCGEELVNHLAQTDLFNFDGNQTVTTHTIGFQYSHRWLKDVADAGNGLHFTTDTAGELTAALENIVHTVGDGGSSLVAPVAAIDSFSKLSHRNDVYLSLFQPSNSPRWNGNIKRYDYSGVPLVLRDVDGQAAINSATGQIDETAKSFWSLTTDGNIVARGGAASMLNPATRSLYTYQGFHENLNHPSNAFSVNNKLITAADLGLDASAGISRHKLIGWSAGQDVDDEDGDQHTTDSRGTMGDPLHSNPVVITYGGDSTDPDSVLYVGTNEGFLHGINTRSGVEEFAFVPDELLSRFLAQYKNSVQDRKIYGLDGRISSWVEDANLNGIVDGLDHAYLYVGMRRGGRHYYAIDVSEKNNPKFKWKIPGNVGRSGFKELGQTWSEMVVGTIRYGKNIKKVLIFSGGYDPANDNREIRAPDSAGRALYIVDADTGQLLWSATAPNSDGMSTFSAMKYSIASSPKLVDINNDGAVDQIYVGDTGGQVWRFDIDSKSDDLEIDGGVIADLAVDGSRADTRRFYHSPDVSISKKQGQLIINVAIGSGYQAHPLNTTVEDRFYLIQIPYGRGGPNKYGIKVADTEDTYRPIVESDLFDATDNVIGEGDVDDVKIAQGKLQNSSGWLLKMNRDGEKILGPSVTFNGSVMFSSYIPNGELIECVPGIGNGVFWAVSLSDATPSGAFQNSEENNSQKNRSKEIPGSGILPPPQTLILETGNTNESKVITNSGGNTLVDHENPPLQRRTYWSEYPNF